MCCSIGSGSELRLHFLLSFKSVSPRAEVSVAKVAIDEDRCSGAQYASVLSLMGFILDAFRDPQASLDYCLHRVHALSSSHHSGQYSRQQTLATCSY